MDVEAFKQAFNDCPESVKWMDQTQQVCDQLVDYVNSVSDQIGPMGSLVASLGLADSVLLAMKNQGANDPRIDACRSLMKQIVMEGMKAVYTVNQENKFDPENN